MQLGPIEENKGIRVSIERSSNTCLLFLKAVVECFIFGSGSSSLQLFGSRGVVRLWRVFEVLPLGFGVTGSTGAEVQPLRRL